MRQAHKTRLTGRTRALAALPPLLLVAVLLAGGAASTLAAGEGVPRPIIRSEAKEEIYATRAHVGIGVTVLPTGSKLSLHFEWESEYAPAEANGAPPAAGSTSWRKAGGGSREIPKDEGAELGAELGGTNEDGSEHTFVRHLQAGINYYARFHVKDEGGTAEATFEFTTLPVSKPELEGGIGIGSSKWSQVTLGAAAVDPFAAQIDPILQANGAEAEYQIDVAPAGAGVTAPPEESSAWVPASAGGSGHLSAAEESLQIKAGATGLEPETIYFARIEAFNHCNQVKPSEKCTLVFTEAFQTPTAKPVASEPGVRNVTGTSAHVSAKLNPHGSETVWRFETAPAPGGPWTPAPGAAGTISQAEAQALLAEETKTYEENGSGGDGEVSLETTLAGLHPDSAYYVRLFAHSAAGEAVACHNDEEEGTLPGSNEHRLVCEPLSTTTQGVASFHTGGAPVASAFATHALQGQAVRLFGSVDPNSAATSAEQTVTLEGVPSSGSFTLSFEGQTTTAIAYDASAGEVEQALRALSTVGSGVNVTGPVGGPYTVFFENALAGKALPLIVANGSGLIAKVASVQQGGEAYDTHYHFEYVPEKRYEAEGGFAKAASTPEVDLGGGGETRLVGEDLPGLLEGETYRYRIAASNDSPGDPVVHGAEQTLVAPAAAVVESDEPCPNQALRSGPSAALPDCRGYEQVTPVDKEGAKEVYAYEALGVGSNLYVGEDGAHLMLDAPVTDWGSGALAGLSPYFFTRSEAGWQMRPFSVSR